MHNRATNEQDISGGGKGRATKCARRKALVFVHVVTCSSGRKQRGAHTHDACDQTVLPAKNHKLAGPKGLPAIVSASAPGSWILRQGNYDMSCHPGETSSSY